jgi:hypothetical protein
MEAVAADTMTPSLSANTLNYAATQAFVLVLRNPIEIRCNDLKL